MEAIAIEKIKIDNTDIFLEDLGEGKGKITISNTYGYNFSYFWGSMGGTLREFLLSINKDYFSMKLNPGSGVFDGKMTVREIRRFIRSDYSWELPWYSYMSAQKEFREKLRELEDCENEHEFIDSASSLADDLLCFDLSYDDERNFKEIVSGIMSEPWNFIQKGPSNETKFLQELLPKIKKEIAKID